MNARRFADFLDRDVGKILLFQKSQKSLVHFGGGCEVFAFRFVQRAIPSLLFFLPRSSMTAAIRIPYIAYAGALCVF